jgi:hypothetical protein
MTSKSAKAVVPIRDAARPPPVRVKLQRVHASLAKAHPPDGEGKVWWSRLARAPGHLLRFLRFWYAPRHEGEALLDNARALIRSWSIGRRSWPKARQPRPRPPRTAVPSNPGHDEPKK